MSIPNEKTANMKHVVRSAYEKLTENGTINAVRERHPFFQSPPKRDIRYATHA